MIARWQAYSKIMRVLDGAAPVAPDRSGVSGRSIALAALAVMAGLGFITFAFGHDLRWPTAWPAPSYRLSIEAILLCAAVLAWPAAYAGQRRALGLLAAAATLLTLGRYADIGAHSLFGRGLDLYWDAQHAPAVFGMILEALGPVQFALLLLAIPLGCVVLWAAMRLAFAGIALGARQKGGRVVLASIMVVLAGVYVAGMVSPRLAVEHRFAVPVTVAWWTKAERAAQAAAELGPDKPAAFEAVAVLPASAPVPMAAAAVPASLAQAGRVAPDVLILFMESMGRAVWSDPVYAPLLAASRDRLAAAAEDEGWHVASAFVGSATFAGGSWLAHSSVLAGAPIERESLYRRLLASDRPALTHRLAEAGWRTVGVMPGLKRLWPEGAYWNYDRLLMAADFGYAGPRFGFWEIPDQAALAEVLRTEFTAGADRAPVLAVFPTVMSHYPFSSIPPYAEDWSGLEDGSAFAAARPALVPGATDGLGLTVRQAGFAEAQAYNFAWLAGALARPELTDAVVLVVGDHQPPASIAGPPDVAGRDVPVHLFARDPELLAPFLSVGFAVGLHPAETDLHQADLARPLLGLLVPESGS